MKTKQRFIYAGMHISLLVSGFIVFFVWLHSGRSIEQVPFPILAGAELVFESTHESRELPCTPEPAYLSGFPNMMCSMNPYGYGVQLDIYYARFDESGGLLEIVNLTSDLDGFARQPVWSHNGEWIAFEYDPPSEVGYVSRLDEIYLMRADGSEKRRILSDNRSWGTIAAPEWSVDDNIIFYSRIFLDDSWGARPCGNINGYNLQTNEDSIILGNCTGGYAYPTKVGSYYAHYLPIPDESLLVAQRGGGGDWLPSISIFDAHLNRVFHTNGLDPAWSPNYQRLALGTHAPLATYCPSFLNPNTGNVLPIIFVPGGSPTWSPDAQYLAYDALYGDRRRIIVARADNPSQAYVLLGETGIAYAHPSWRPHN